MDDDETSKNMETNLLGEHISKVPNARNVFQSIWVRCGSVISYINNREHLLRQFNFVLYFGVILWIIFSISKII